MKSPSTDFAALQSKLSALSQQFQPVDALNLIQVAIPFIRACAQNQNDTQTIHYILQTWLARDRGSNWNMFTNPPRQLNYTVCYQCGNAYPFGGRILIANCQRCSRSHPLALHFLLDFLSHSYPTLSYDWWEYFIAEYLLQRYVHEHRSFTIRL